MSAEKQPRIGSDRFAQWERWSQYFQLFPLALLLIVIIATAGVALFKKGNDPALVIYTSQDQQFAEPILAAFTRQTGVRVRAVYDSEAVKTVGLANRLIAEAKHPQCDVWWSNEALRTHQLAARGVLETNTIVEFGFRSRRFVINTNQLSSATAPSSLLELTNTMWRGKFALAYPMFGTTSTQFIALRQRWGEAGWEAWCRALAANKPFVVDGNSVVVKLVGRGEVPFGLTDFDDIAAGQREGLPVVALPLKSDAVVIPNSAAIVRGSRSAASAQRLIDFLTSKETMAELIGISALEGNTPPEELKLDWARVAHDLEPATKFLSATFLR